MPSNISSYINSLMEAKFVLYLYPFDQVSESTCMMIHLCIIYGICIDILLLFFNHYFVCIFNIIYKTFKQNLGLHQELVLHVPILCGSLPVIINLEYENKIYIETRKLPVVFVENISSITKLFLESSYESVVHANATRQNYSLSSLFSPYWLPSLVPIEQSLAHVHRRDLYTEFLDLSISKSVEAIEQPASKKTICQAPSVYEGQETSTTKTKTPRKLLEESSSSRYIVDIVIPRCCETFAGDIS